MAKILTSLGVDMERDRKPDGTWWRRGVSIRYIEDGDGPLPLYSIGEGEWVRLNHAQAIAAADVEAARRLVAEATSKPETPEAIRARIGQIMTELGDLAQASRRDAPNMSYHIGAANACLSRAAITSEA